MLLLDRACGVTASNDPVLLTTLAAPLPTRAGRKPLDGFLLLRLALPNTAQTCSNDFLNFCTKTGNNNFPNVRHRDTLLIRHAFEIDIRGSIHLDRNKPRCVDV